MKVKVKHVVTFNSNVNKKNKENQIRKCQAKHDE